MSLYKEVTLTVSNYSSKLNSDIQFYKNDALDLIFNIYEYGIQVKQRGSSYRMMPINPLKAKLLIETPFGVDSVESARIEENQVVFFLDDSYIQNVDK